MTTAPAPGLRNSRLNLSNQHARGLSETLYLLTRLMQERLVNVACGLAAKRMQQFSMRCAMCVMPFALMRRKACFHFAVTLRGRQNIVLVSLRKPEKRSGT